MTDNVIRFPRTPKGRDYLRGFLHFGPVPLEALVTEDWDIAAQDVDLLFDDDDEFNREGA